MGNHSQDHLLYCDWTKRDSLLVTKDEFRQDLLRPDIRLAFLYKGTGNSYFPATRKYFLPPYEWYNDTIAAWSREYRFQLVNYTPGTLSHADYTRPSEKNYRSSDLIYQSILNYENQRASGLNGFILLMHIGTHPERTDKFYYLLPKLIKLLKEKGYSIVPVPELISLEDQKSIK